MSEGQSPSGTLSRGVLVGMILLAGGLMLARLAGAGGSGPWLAALFTSVTEGGMAALLFVSAGGFGYPLVRALAPKSAGSSLRATTSVAVGLCLFSTAMLLAGSVGAGLFRIWIWWPIVNVGVLLAAWWGRKALERWRPATHFDGRALLWVLVALAAGLWLAGATRPPGAVGAKFLRTNEEFFVLHHHLQVPAEYYHAQSAAPLNHNCWSYPPQGMGMLNLLAMVLRGGPYEGMYLAKMLGGMFVALAAGAIFTELKRDDDARARIAAGLLVCSPFVIYFSWLATGHLLGVCYLAMALLWLRRWVSRPCPRSALFIGIMLGGACSADYYAAVTIAAPVLIAMPAVSLKRRAAAWHAAPAAAVVVLMISPWLIRSAAATGNPLFPMFTGALGAGHWSAESQQRWDNASAVDDAGAPPVPAPPDWKPAAPITRLERLYVNFLVSQWFGPLVKVLAGVAVCVVVAAAGGGAWDLSLVVVWGGQLVAWMLFAPRMGDSYLMPSIVPMVLLIGGMLSRLARIRANPLRRGSAPPPQGAWGLVPAAVVFLTAAGVNLVHAYTAYRAAAAVTPPWHGIAGGELARRARPWAGAWKLRQDNPNARILLVGELQHFYFPPGTRYATAFDSQPLDEMVRQGLTDQGILSELSRLGITHLWVNWYGLRTTAEVWGMPASLAGEPLGRFAKEQPPGLALLDRLAKLGLRKVDMSAVYAASAPATQGGGWRRAWLEPAVYELPATPAAGN